MIETMRMLSISGVKIHKTLLNFLKKNLIMHYKVTCVLVCCVLPIPQNWKCFVNMMALQSWTPIKNDIKGGRMNKRMKAYKEFIEKIKK